MGIDQQINEWLTPVADALAAVVFFKVPVGGAELPLIVLWLVAAGTFFTIYLRGINVRGLPAAVSILRRGGGAGAGDISAFAALSTAVSGTVGIGNIGGVAIALSLGGPGAMFWMVVAGALGMATKCAECILGVRYRVDAPDGTVSGGPMYALDRGLADRGMPGLGKALGRFYAATIVFGCFGIGDMFQSNQAYLQFVVVTGGEQSFFADKGWLFGLLIAGAVGAVIIGGIQRIARVTSTLVPLMAGLYVIGGLAVIAMNASAVPGAFAAMWTEAFSTQAASGGALGAMIIGFQRAAFSNEAGLGSAAIAHSAVQTDHPATEGLVALLEPLIDTIIICTITALVILTTIYDPQLAERGLQGVEITSAAFESTIPGSPTLVAVAALLFAYSTMIAWSYYGLKGWTYLLGDRAGSGLGFKLAFCVFGVLGCTLDVGAVLDLSDALIFVVAIPNVIGLYLMAPEIRATLQDYLDPKES